MTAAELAAALERFPYGHSFDDWLRLGIAGMRVVYVDEGSISVIDAPKVN